MPKLKFRADDSEIKKATKKVFISLATFIIIQLYLDILLISAITLQNYTVACICAIGITLTVMGITVTIINFIFSLASTILELSYTFDMTLLKLIKEQ